MGLVNRIGGVSAANQALIDGAQQVSEKNQNSGYLGIDANGYANIDGLIPRTGTPTELFALAPEDGEISSRNDIPQLYVPAGDATNWPIGLNSSSILILTPDEDQALNGARLAAAYSLIQSFSPNGVAKSATNRVALGLIGGKWELGVQVSPVDFCDIIGVFEKPEIIANGTLGYNLSCNAKDFTFNFLKISNSTPTVGAPFALIGSNTIVQEDVEYAVGAGNVATIMPINGIQSGSLKRVTTDGINLFGGASLTKLNMDIEDCRGGDNSFGGANVVAAAFVQTNHTFKNVVMFGTTWNGKLGDGMVLDHCDWGAEIPRIDSTVGADSPIIKYCTLRGTTNCISNDAAGKLVRLSHCDIVADLHANVANHYGTHAASFNLLNADV